MSDPNQDQKLDEGWADDEAAEGGEGAGPGDGGAAEADGERERRPANEEREPQIEPSDERTKKALVFLRDVVREMEMDCVVELRRSKDDSPEEIALEIIGRDAGRIIGKKGQVLAALQFLTNRIVNRPGLERRHVMVDAEGYRSRRDSSLATMARRLGKQAVDEGKIITFEPMNPRDRRVVHLALAKFEGVITKSEGEGEERRVQIIPVRRTTT